MYLNSFVIIYIINQKANTLFSHPSDKTRFELAFTGKNSFEGILDNAPNHDPLKI